MKVKDVLAEAEQLSPALKARKAAHEKYIEACKASDEKYKTFDKFWTKQNQEDQYTRHRKEKDEEIQILHKAFGSKGFTEFNSGANSGEAEGKKYNTQMAKLGFTEMETEQNGKPVPAWGQKPELRTKWKLIGRVKGYLDSTSFYQLKDSNKVVVMATYSPGMKGCRTLFVEK